MNSNDQFLGIVQLGQFQILAPEHAAGEFVRLTRIQMQEALPPEIKEVQLSQYEGQAIMVRGQYSGKWICSAEVIDQAGPILTDVVRQVFGPTTEAS
jgi:hypothetical protein